MSSLSLSLKELVTYDVFYSAFCHGDVCNANAMESKQFQFPDVPTTVDNKTIIFVYEWFGLWNDNFCFRNEAKEKLTQILKDKSEVKLIIVMRSDVQSNHKVDLAKYHNLFCNEFNLLDEKLPDDCFEHILLISSKGLGTSSNNLLVPDLTIIAYILN